MKTFDDLTIKLIHYELDSIPEEYQKDFNSIHEGYAVILEEVRELEQEVFFGKKKAKIEVALQGINGNQTAMEIHKQRMREECVQIAAMCARFIQELT
jgi:hypothetical protein